MAVTSTTVGGVNCWQFSGAVTQAEITTAWAGLLVNGEYTPGRALYFDDTCDMRNVQGGFSVHMTTGINSIILHTNRNRENTTLRYWNIRYTVGLSVADRGKRCVGFDGTVIAQLLSGDDGLNMFGGSHTYSVVGNAGGGGDTRFLDDFAFGVIGGGLQVSSAAFTEQEMQPNIRGQKELSDITFTRLFGFPQAAGSFTRLVLWRCSQNTMTPTQQVIRLVTGASACYVGCVVRRNGVPITANLMQTAGTTATIKAACAVFNNWRDESWFGVSKTTMPIASWVAGNIMYGGVLKKLQFVGIGATGVVKCYDSRSTTAPQRATFVGNTAFDFLAAGTTTATDADGKVWLAFVGADVATNLAITRYTGQRYTMQAFGYRVSVTSIDMTAGGDDNTSSYAPVVPTVQPALSRSEAAINAATIIDNFQQLLEELHVLALGLSGAASYAGTYGGNLFDLVNGTLTTSFASVTVDATAASKISYNSTTNALTIKSTTLASNATVSAWTNATGTISTANGATITGTFTDSTGTRVTIRERTDKLLSTYVTVNGTPVGGTVVDGTLRAGWVPLSAARVITVQPADAIRIAASFYGSKPTVFNMLGSEIEKFTLSLDLEPAIDTTTNTTIRDEITACFSTVTNGATLEVTINKTLKAYTPKQVLAGLDYYIVSRGFLLHGAIAQNNNASLYAMSEGTIVTYSPAYKIRMSDLDALGNPIVPTTIGYEVPLVIYYEDLATGIKSTMTLLNASGAFLGTAPWTQQQASIGDADKQAIADTAAIEVWTAPTRTLTSGGGGGGGGSGATAQEVWEYASRTLTAGVPTAAQNASAVRTELATELSRVDVATSTRLAETGYTAPDNAGITAIKAKTDTLVNGPTLVQIEGSTILAKEATSAAIKAETDNLGKLRKLIIAMNNA
jgi:hypothetical protein